ncbi:MAG: glycoside hydrolase family 3 C-terminal domain-containing protein, partial [Flavobacterium sp.]|uniref:glycoside hydrolase family 3 C-terminal domain-containing protein n=1 Tax=Flavobacterium sp. TaxID=239 RepID=UPI003D121069
MPVDMPGFKGGDRTSILLPEVQTRLLKALQSSGKPVVFLMMTGSAIAVPWEAENIPAILNIWYGGQSAGTASADVVFGDYNPAGRLPVTFYKSDSDLPPFVDYKMDNKTYRYFKGTPLYGFGYGLSYTEFKYSGVKAPAKIKKGQSATISVKVTNTGKMEGEEVAQLYLINQDTSIKSPLKSLKGFERFNLKPGQSTVINFNLSPEDLSYVTESGTLKSYEGKIRISVGGFQPDEKNQSKNNIITQTLEIEK